MSLTREAFNQGAKFSVFKRLLKACFDTAKSLKNLDFPRIFPVEHFIL